MLTLSKSIWTKYNASTTFKAAINAFYYGKAVQDASLPYGVYTFGGTINENTFREKIDEVTVQMNIYTESDTTATECFTAYELCRDLYENAVLTVSDSYDVTLTKIMEVPPMEISDGTKWMAVLEFSLMLQKK